MKFKPGLVIFSFFIITMNAFGQNEEPKTWADSVFQKMTLKEKIGQLFIIRAHSDKTKSYHEHVGRTVKNFGVGGVCFFQGGPRRQAVLTNKYQKLSEIPLFVAQDAEWGLGMRLDSTMSFPRQMTMGAVRENSLIYEMGKEVAQHLKRVGVNMNFAPVSDVNNNPDNPVINSRSFGENPQVVARKASMYMYGLQDNGVIATAKHFPGHGDTDMDSHEALPVIPFSKARLDSVELVPFKHLIKEGVSAIMTAHLYIPEIETLKKQASTLSKPIITGLLKDSLGYEGLIITDALEMSGVTQNNELGELEVKALLAGNDILLMPVNIKKAIKRIETAVKSGRLPEKELDEKVLKILRFKQRYNIHNTKEVNTKGLQQNLHNDFAKHNIRNIAKEAITIVKNEQNLLPLKRTDTLKIATVATGVTNRQPFQEMLSRYHQVTHFQLPKKASEKSINDLIEKLSDYNLVIISIHNTSSFPSRDFGISKPEKILIDSLAKQKKVILDVFGIPYALN
ncbi:MAG TPA: glycoside hydrolase family 3 protein, partial [Bacteroidales bacterium]|nr:glycoside hydrolase family 3 protein [Bacteroidales bacterium]